MVVTAGSTGCSVDAGSEGVSPGTGDFARLGRGGTAGIAAVGRDGDSASSFPREGRGGMDGGEVMTGDMEFSLRIGVMELAVAVWMLWR